MLKFTSLLIGWIVLPASLAIGASGITRAETAQFSASPSRLIARNRARPTAKNPCLEYSHGFVLAKTKSFYIEICGSQTRPLTYYISRNYRGKSYRPEKIFDLRSYRFARQLPSDREFFIAIRGNIKHTLTRQKLIMQQNGLIIMTEPVIYYRRLS